MTQREIIEKYDNHLLIYSFIGLQIQDSVYASCYVDVVGPTICVTCGNLSACVKLYMSHMLLITVHGGTDLKHLDLFLHPSLREHFISS